MERETEVEDSRKARAVAVKLPVLCSETRSSRARIRSDISANPALLWEEIYNYQGSSIADRLPGTPYPRRFDMEFGVFILAQRRSYKQSSAEVIHNAIEQTVTAEAAGFNTAWFAEHHFNNYSLTPSPLMAVAHAAGRTST